jgi:hypothetical protein
MVAALGTWGAKNEVENITNFYGCSSFSTWVYWSSSYLYDGHCSLLFFFFFWSGERGNCWKNILVSTLKPTLLHLPSKLKNRAQPTRSQF